MKWACLCVVTALALPASAHPLQMGYLHLDAHASELAISLEVDVGAAAVVLGVPEASLDGDAVRARAGQLAAATYRGVPIATCSWGTPAAELRRRTVVLSDVATCTGELHALHWPLPFVSRVSATFQLLVDARGLGAEHVVIVDSVTPALDLAGGGSATTVSLPGFVWKGVEHIGAAPSQWHGPHGFHLPDGIDHILFLLGLLLAGGSLARLVGIASGFTVGHTITLGLAAFGIVRPPASLIEPLIALTIAFVAVEAYSGKFEKHRWKIASCFGLVHGFGFANALTELHLSRVDMVKALFGYNFGVEVGQIIIVVLLAPLVLAAHRDPWLRRYVVRALAAAIFFAGMYWFFMRL